MLSVYNLKSIDVSNNTLKGIIEQGLLIALFNANTYFKYNALFKICIDSYIQKKNRDKTNYKS